MKDDMESVILHIRCSSPHLNLPLRKMCCAVRRADKQGLTHTCRPEPVSPLPVTPLIASEAVLC